MLGQTSVRNTLHYGCAYSIRRRLHAFNHVVQQIIEDMPGIHRDLIQFRHNTIDAEGLIAQLACFDHIIAETHIGGRALLLSAYIGQVFGGHVAMLAVRAGHFVPADEVFSMTITSVPFLYLPRILYFVPVPERRRSGSRLC